VTLALSAIAASNPAYASPIRGSNPNRWKSYPTAYAASISVTDPTYAYDMDNATYAAFRYAGADGYFELKTFKTPTWGGGATPSTINSVDLKIRYSTTLSSKDDKYRIVYYVGTAGPVVLKDWGRDATPLDTYVWTGVSEPTDGTWTWTDIGDIRVRFETDRVGGGDSGGNVNLHEVWAAVISPDTKLSVDPAQIIDDTKVVDSSVTFKLKVSEIYDFAGIEIKIKWNPNVLNVTHPWISGIVNSPTDPGNITVGPFFPSNSFLWYNASGINASEPTVNKQYIWVSFTLPMGTPKGGGLSGTGFVLQIDFTVVGIGTTDIILYDVELGDTYAQNIPSINENGYFSNVGVPEFPLGLIMEIALGVSIITIWLKKKRRFTTPT
jgi:hypothetical protein